MLIIFEVSFLWSLAPREEVGWNSHAHGGTVIPYNRDKPDLPRYGKPVKLPYRLQ